MTNSEFVYEYLALPLPRTHIIHGRAIRTIRDACYYATPERGPRRYWQVVPRAALSCASPDVVCAGFEWALARDPSGEEVGFIC
jgi:hypothetical protein